jgi:hypothetical protein
MVLSSYNTRAPPPDITRFTSVETLVAQGVGTASFLKDAVVIRGMVSGLCYLNA